MNKSPLHIVVLAAGEGRRMVSSLPKVLLPIAGRPMLQHVLDAANQLQPDAVHVVHGHRGTDVQAAFADQPQLRWVHQAEQNGTGHAVQLALADIPDQARVLVLYGDVPLLRASTLDILCGIQAAPLAVLSVFLENPHGYGRIVCDGAGRVSAIVEQRDATAEQRRIKTVNTGIIAADALDLRRWLGEIRADNAQSELYLTDVFALAAAEHRPALAVPCADPEEAQGANDPMQLAMLERVYQSRAVAALCAQGVRVADPARIDIRGEVTAGKDVWLDANVVLEGRVSLGDGVQVGPFTRIANATLAAGTKIQAHCDIDGVQTRGACQVGPFARLRPGTVLEEGVHLGNFVEVKNTHLGANAKAGHLAYLGDAQIGARVNISAGVITCNYDGAYKHQTVIGDDAFVGSDSQLVAPVEIGENAYVAAGSTIAQGVPADALAICRAREQKIVPGWKRPKKAADTSG